MGHDVREGCAESRLSWPWGRKSLVLYAFQGSIGEEMREGCAELGPSCLRGRISLVVLRLPGGSRRKPLVFLRAPGARERRSLVFSRARIRMQVRRASSKHLRPAECAKPLLACLMHAFSPSSITSSFRHLLSGPKHGVGPQGARRI